ncbi:MAG: hypothetical protein ACREK6_19410, partial [Candidatus Rokuibacteriota bacterium]
AARISHYFGPTRGALTTSRALTARRRRESAVSSSATVEVGLAAEEPEEVPVDPFDKLDAGYIALSHRHLDPAEPFLLQSRKYLQKKRDLFFRNALWQTEIRLGTVRVVFYPRT